MHVEPWTPDLGAVVAPDATHARLLDLDPAALLSELEAHGVLLLRGFEAADLGGFAAFTESFELPFLLHGGIAHGPVEGAAPTIREVTGGTEAVGVHSEASGLPVRPDVLWFMCQQPAAVGGETVVCDGRALLAALPEVVVEVFRERRLRYDSGPRGITPDEWGRAFGTDDPAEAERRIAAFVERLDPRLEQVVLRREEGGRFVGHYDVSAIVPGRGGAPEAFANALFGPYRVFPSFADGAPMPDSLLDVVGQTLAPLCRRVTWRAGDVVMVDNWRVMHGRLPFLGARRIVTRMAGARCDFPLFSV